MISNRQKYFELINLNHKNLHKNIIETLLIEVNNFSSVQELYLKFDLELNNGDLLDFYVEKIKNGEPYQYVIHKSNFANFDFYVDENVLIPRQETEELVLYKVLDKISQIYNRQNIKLVDVCTGSGCIGISLKKLLLEKGIDADTYLTDISKEALEVASKNAKNLNVDVTILRGNLLEPLIERNIEVDVIISNPPYIGSKDTVDPQTLEYEPHLALFATPKTKFYEEIFIQSQKVLKENGLLIFEIGEDMEEELKEICFKYFKNKEVVFYKDFYQKSRFLFII